MWMRELTYVNCKKLEVKDNVNHKSEFYEYDTKISTSEGSNFIYKTVKKLRRKCALNLKDEIINLTDWEEYCTPVEYKIPINKCQIF
jgi:hypothetical protein